MRIHTQRENRYLLEVVSVIIIILLLSTPDIDSQYSLLKVLHRLNAIFVCIVCSFAFTVAGKCFLHLSHKSVANLYKSCSHSQSRNEENVQAETIIFSSEK